MYEDLLYIEKELKEESSHRMEILWKKTDNGARILRVYSQNLLLQLPSAIEGNPVTEIGTYCFSPSEIHSQESHDWRLTKIEKEERRIERASLPEVTGNHLEGIILPDSLESLGNSAFYNCRKLRFLSLGTHLVKLGSDVFRNCLNLSQITLRASSQEKTLLPLILERIQTEIEVHFSPENMDQECYFLFPECYEWFDDMITAHVFNRVIVGEGFRMRQCFKNHRINIAKYDQCFATSVSLEEDYDICRIAMNRLRWPVELKEENRSIYEQAIRDRYDSMIKLVITHRDMDCLVFLCQHFNPDDTNLNVWMDSCIRADWTEGSLYLITQKQKEITFADKSYDFEDWE